MTVIEIPQIDGHRIIAVAERDAALVAERPEMIDHVEVHACMDVDSGGNRTWEFPFGCRDSFKGRRAIQQFLTKDD